MSPRQIVVSGGFDDLRPHDIRFLEEASKLGVLTGAPAKFPIAERLYLLNALRYVNRAVALTAIGDPNGLPDLKGVKADVWVDVEGPRNDARRFFCARSGIEYQVLAPKQLADFPAPPPLPLAPGRKKVIVTGCYDWFHSGHVRFFEEVSTHGDLHVIVGHDANIRLLKGPGHPLLPQEARRYTVGSVKYVTQALISSGNGWLDAEPEIRQLKPDIYAVNEDGDRGGKREYCRQLGIEYLVLKRTPAPGLPPRSSTNLRGF
jgi:cytidyltransferase-like protein